jgi:hypothetical protein
MVVVQYEKTIPSESYSVDELAEELGDRYAEI